MATIVAFIFLLLPILFASSDQFENAGNGEAVRRDIFIFDLTANPNDPFSRPMIQLEVGNPARTFRAYFAFGQTGVIFVDKTCGERRKDCARYCSDDLWADLYCHPLCHSITPQYVQFICGQQNERYDLEASSTGTLLNGEFMARYPDRRPISARYVADQLKIVGLDGHDFYSPNTTFISALSADIRFFESDPLYADALFGFSPMDGALIRQWYEQKLIRKPLLSLAAFYSRGVLGHVDPQRCDLRTLVYHELTSPKYWVIEADSFAITGFREFGRTLLSSVPDVPGSGMPQHVADFFFQQGLFMIEYDILFVRCNASIEVMFRLGDHHYNWNLVSPQTEDDSDWCQSDLWIVDGRYSNNPGWQLGGRFLNAYCHVYNYENSTLGLAHYRRPLRETP